MEKAETVWLKKLEPAALHQIYKFLPREDMTMFCLPFFILIPDSHVEITAID